MLGKIARGFVGIPFESLAAQLELGIHKTSVYTLHIRINRKTKGRQPRSEALLTPKSELFTRRRPRTFSGKMTSSNFVRAEYSLQFGEQEERNERHECERNGRRFEVDYGSSNLSVRTILYMGV